MVDVKERAAKAPCEMLGNDDSRFHSSLTILLLFIMTSDKTRAPALAVTIYQSHKNATQCSSHSSKVADAFRTIAEITLTYRLIKGDIWCGPSYVQSGRRVSVPTIWPCCSGMQKRNACLPPLPPIDDGSVV